MYCIINIKLYFFSPNHCNIYMQAKTLTTRDIYCISFEIFITIDLPKIKYENVVLVP